MEKAAASPLDLIRIGRFRQEMLATMDLATATPKQLQRLLAIEVAHERDAGAPPPDWSKTADAVFCKTNPIFRREGDAGGHAGAMSGEEARDRQWNGCNAA